MGLAAVMTGCQQRDPAVGGDMLPRDGAAGQSLGRVLLAQSATGAGGDRMLYDHHFDGAHLNSLGREKVHLMLEDPSFLASPQIYLVGREGRARAGAVTEHLGDLGIPSDGIRLLLGFNPDSSRPVVVAEEQRRSVDETRIERAR